MVTILPQKEAAERIGGERVTVGIMVPPGASPHSYEPTPGQMKDLAGVALYAEVGSGVDFELAWLDKLVAVNQDMRVVNCSDGINLQQTIRGEEIDPHVWLSPQNAITMAENLCEGLITIDPDYESYYRANCTAYLEQLEELDTSIAIGFAEVTNRKFIVYHPAFGYFASRYDLTMIPVEDEGKEPTAQGIASVIGQAKTNNIKVIFASPQFNPESAEAIAAEIGGEVIFIDPLAENYIENLSTVAAQMSAIME